MKSLALLLIAAGLALAQVPTIPNELFPQFRTDLNTSLGNAASITGAYTNPAWLTFTQAGGRITGFEVPLTFGTGVSRSVNAVNCVVATGSTFGCITAADWATFNAKLANPMTTAGDFIVGGSAGAPIRLAVPGNGTYCPNWSSGTVTWITCPGAGGGLSSVGLTMPAWFSVSSSPLIANGTLGVTAATGQTSHQVIGTCGTGTSFGPCTLVPGDIPTLNQSTTGNAGTATALAALPTPCSAGNYFLGILANGNSTGCTPVPVVLTSGAGAPVASCTAASSSGFPLYTDTTNHDPWWCPVTNTWKRLLSMNPADPFEMMGMVEAPPTTPAAGNVKCYFDFTSLTLVCLDENGRAFTMVRGISPVSNEFLTNVDVNGAQQHAQPAFSNLSGGATTAQLPGSGATTVNGQTCTLGSTCNVNVGAAAHSVALNQGNGAAQTGAAIGTSGRVFLDQGAGADPSFNAMSGDVTITNAGVATVANNAITGAKMANNTVTSSQLAVVNTRRVCEAGFGSTSSSSALANADLGPQKGICFIPYAATVVEIDVIGDAGTPNIIVGVNHAGSVSNLVSSALATAASGGRACSKTTAVAGLDGTTCSATLQNTSVAVGDYIEAVSGTAGGTAKWMSVHVVYTVN